MRPKSPDLKHQPPLGIWDKNSLSDRSESRDSYLTTLGRMNSLTIYRQCQVGKVDVVIIIFKTQRRWKKKTRARLQRGKKGPAMLV